jgi:glutamyl-tRNA synthetase
MTIVTRFAPSPTGMLHIGSARTALFNWVYAKHCNGKYLLRIEDTDKERSTAEATTQVLDSLEWLGLNADAIPVIQSERVERHCEVAQELINRGKAYYCYMTQDEIESQRQDNPYAHVKSPWRNGDIAPRDDVQPVVRMRFPIEGITSFNDIVQGELQIHNSELTDIIILRSDNTPTYLLAVVVDDHDMGVNYVVRGDDHITNTFKQILIYQAMDWTIPKHGHVPLIHGADGSKLSKRHGALGIGHYRDAGYLPEALCNYLLRLGWGGDGYQELLTKEEAIKIFDVADISRAPAKFDQDKLNFINSHYLNIIDEERLFELVMDFWNGPRDVELLSKARRAIGLFKVRCNTLVEVAQMFNLLVRKSDLDEQSRQLLSSYGHVIPQLKSVIMSIEMWTFDNIKAAFKSFASVSGLKDSIVMQCLRAFIMGTFASPGIYQMMEILGKDNSIKRIDE